MGKTYILILGLFLSTCVYANDGSYQSQIDELFKDQFSNCNENTTENEFQNEWKEFRNLQGDKKKYEICDSLKNSGLKNPKEKNECKKYYEHKVQDAGEKGGQCKDAINNKINAKKSEEIEAKKKADEDEKQRLKDKYLK